MFLLMCASWTCHFTRGCACLVMGSTKPWTSIVPAPPGTLIDLRSNTTGLGAPQCVCPRLWGSHTTHKKLLSQWYFPIASSSLVNHDVVLLYFPLHDVFIWYMNWLKSMCNFLWVSHTFLPFNYQYVMTLAVVWQLQDNLIAIWIGPSIRSTVRPNSSQHTKATGWLVNIISLTSCAQQILA
jgi:hypothetical protein